MKTLLILRHAKSSWSNATLGDHDRPLNERGKADAPRMGKLLKQEGLTPDLIISSSAERALATAEAVALASDYDAEIQVTRQLYLADPEDYLEALRERGGSHNRVMVVGHNPGIEELVAQLAQQFETMSTATLAQIDLSISNWRELDDEIVGTLVNVWRPKEMNS
ncbi:MAG: histidine phosphatase family protein [Ardenticatenaceae bacterium]|nr:histidine phosphatase family protein [Ardenticatenaceae bacterium]MCB9002941.1 histidine phosphatase family protein [Ardenticatenaceae bacterium]